MANVWYWVTRLVRRLAPLTVGLLIVFLCLELEENFPFSHFPMYNGFDDWDYYVYLTDKNGDPFPVETITYFRTSKLKKVYNEGLLEVRADLKKAGIKKRKREITVEDAREKGDFTLQWLYGSSRPWAQERLREFSPIRLYRVEVTQKNGNIVETPPLLAGEIDVPKLEDQP